MPGDVLSKNSGTVDILAAGTCSFGFKWSGPVSSAPPMPSWDEDWVKPWRKWAKDAEVIHVAGEKGEAE